MRWFALVGLLALACQEVSGTGGGADGSIAGGGADGSVAGGGDGGAAGGDAGAPADCAGRVAVEAHVVDDRLYTRADAVRIAFGVRPADASVEVRGGGHAQVRADGAYWTAGGGADGDVPWPWWTGPVHLTVRARDARGCTGEAAVDVRLAGDVVVGEWSRSYLFAYGSDGRRLGKLAQIGEQGINDVIALPESAGGGLVVALRWRDEAGPKLVRVDRDGHPTDFETTDHAGAPLYPDDRHEPEHVAWDPVRQEVVADGGAHHRVYRWNARGEYVDAHVMDGLGSPFDDQPVGFGVLGDGTLVASHGGEDEVWRLLDDGPAIFASFDDGVRALGTGRDGGVVAIVDHFGDTLYVLLDAHGREVHKEALSGLPYDHITPFRDGYLVTQPASSAPRYMDANLRLVESADSPWMPQSDFDDVGAVGGAVWLDPR